jgi:16S rRNA (adenine1518-N6/adenine1519-N6)-dimethyltransferase
MLISNRIADRLIDSCPLTNQSRVLEIGAGHGILTRKLAERVACVQSFEIDRDLFTQTQRALSEYKNVQLVCADAFDYDLGKSNFDVCMSSLPYSESLRFIKWAALRSELFKIAIIIVQKEFADKLQSLPGSQNYRAVSVVAQLRFQIETIFDVRKEDFDPPPKVASRAIRLLPLAGQNSFFFDLKRLRMLDYLFSFRGRLLSSPLKNLLPEEKRGPYLASVVSSRIESINPAEYAEILYTVDRLIS